MSVIHAKQPTYTRRQRPDLQMEETFWIQLHAIAKLESTSPDAIIARAQALYCTLPINRAVRAFILNHYVSIAAQKPPQTEAFYPLTPSKSIKQVLDRIRHAENRIITKPLAYEHNLKHKRSRIRMV